MGLEDLANKAKAAFEENKDKVEGALKSDQAEKVSDKVLDGAESLINKVTGDKFADQVADGKAKADEAIGKE